MRKPDKGKAFPILLALSVPLWAACSDGAVEPPSPRTETPATAEGAAEKGGLTLVRSPSAELPGPPFYARTAPPPEPIFMVDGWAVVQFYRDPGCVPPDFNLLLFFDPPTAFGCTLLVEGFALHEGGPSMGSIPKVVRQYGVAPVPYWFFPAAVVDEAIEDGVLTIGELAGLPGRLVGYATTFNEMQHADAPPSFGEGGHQNPMLTQTAHGTLEDGRRFEYHLTEIIHKDVRSIRLRFE